jgi:DNA-binding protein
MSEDDIKQNNNQQGGKPTAATVFKQLNQAKIKAKGEELKKAVEELVKVDALRDAAFEKVNTLEEEIDDLTRASLPV